MSYVEQHTYQHPVDSDEGQRERVEFLYHRLLVLNRGNEKKVRALLRRPGRDINKAGYRQFQQEALAERFGAQGRPPVQQLARQIVQERGGGDKVDVDRFRKQIATAVEAREKGIAAGTWKPPQISSGSSVEKTDEDR